LAPFTSREGAAAFSRAELDLGKKSAAIFAGGPSSITLMLEMRILGNSDDSIPNIRPDNELARAAVIADRPVL